jgi:hypothetical protein
MSRLSGTLSDISMRTASGVASDPAPDSSPRRRSSSSMRISSFVNNPDPPAPAGMTV